MRGVGLASGAVTIVNALFTGLGCAVAVGLPVRAEIELRADNGSGANKVRLDRGSDSTLVRGTLAAGLAKYASGETFSGALRIDSNVPPAKGLKSSSAVGVAVLRAVENALHQSHSPDELARLASDVAQQIGLSATGAYDDCMAAILGGVVLTDNSRRLSLRTAPFDFDSQVVLWIPPATHAPSSTWAARFRQEASAGRVAAKAAKSGRWPEAMALNTALVERLVGYEYSGLRAALSQNGAVMSGVSGMGPTLATFVPKTRVADVVHQLPPNAGEVRVVEVRRAEVQLEGSL